MEDPSGTARLMGARNADSFMQWRALDPLLVQERRMSKMLVKSDAGRTVLVGTPPPSCYHCLRQILWSASATYRPQLGGTPWYLGTRPREACYLTAMKVKLLWEKEKRPVSSWCCMLSLHRGFSVETEETARESVHPPFRKTQQLRVPICCAKPALRAWYHPWVLPTIYGSRRSQHRERACIQTW